MVTLRLATADDRPFVVALEKEYAALGFVGTDGEENRLAAGYVILCGRDTMNRCIALKRVVISRPGQGLGRQALAVTLEMVFTELGAHRLWLDVYVENERARRTYGALGLVEEGRILRAEETLRAGDGSARGGARSRGDRACGPRVAPTTRR